MGYCDGVYTSGTTCPTGQTWSATPPGAPSGATGQSTLTGNRTPADDGTTIDTWGSQRTVADLTGSWLSTLQGTRPADYMSLKNQLKKSGFLSKGSNSSESMITALTDAGNAALARENSGATDHTDLQGFLEFYQQQTGGGATSGKDKSPAVSTQLSTEFDAHKIVNDALNQYLGKEATASESAEFLKLLNSREKANPQVRTTSGNDSTYTGGFDATAQADLAKSYATSRSDYAETQANTTLQDWFGKAITSMQNDRIA